MKLSEVFADFEEQFADFETEPYFMARLTDEAAHEVLSRVMKITRGEENPKLVKEWINMAWHRIYLHD